MNNSKTKIESTLGFGLAIIFVLGYCLMLAGSVADQLLTHSLPCPLCTLQRMAMAMTSIGPMWIIIATLKGTINSDTFARGYGLSLVFSMFGIVAAARQVLLHIAPHDPGSGPAVFGIHFYTYSLISFLVIILFCGINLVFIKELTPQAETVPHALKVIADIAMKFMFFMVVLMFILMIFEEGFNFLLPGDPVRYQLFDLFK